MALALLHDGIAPALGEGYSWTPEGDELRVRFGRGRFEQRSSRTLGREFRRYTVPYLVDAAARERLVAFLQARSWTQDAFLLVDAYDRRRTGAALTPSSDGATLVFAIAATGTWGGDYPIGNPVLYRAGVPNAGTLSVQTDARTITTTSAPAAGAAAMTADYDYARLVVLVARPRWEPWGGGALFRTSIELLEVPA